MRRVIAKLGETEVSYYKKRLTAEIDAHQVGTPVAK